jgi:hypothetical protein
MPVINPLKALFNLQSQKHYPAQIVNLQPKLLRIHLSSEEIWISIVVSCKAQHINE